MITAEIEVETGLDVESEDDSEYEYEYPPELIERWIRETEISKQKLAKGEIKPQSVQDVAAKYGVILD